MLLGKEWHLVLEEKTLLASVRTSCARLKSVFAPSGETCMARYGLARAQLQETGRGIQPTHLGSEWLIDLGRVTPQSAFLRDSSSAQMLKTT